MPPTGFESVTIEGFKSIRSIQNLRLRPINILIGANGSGKSNFLEAFAFLSEAQAGRMDSYVQFNGGAQRLLYFGSKTTQQITVSADTRYGYSLTASYLSVADDSLAGMVAKGGFSQEGRSFALYKFQDSGNYSPFKRTNQLDDNRRLRGDGSNLAAFLYRLSKTDHDSYLAIRNTVRLVAPFFEDFRLEPLVVNPDTLRLEWRHKQADSYFNASSFSEGTLRFIALATLFLQPVELRPAVILIDEPELGLHPYAVELLASLIRQASIDTQIIAATQSPLLLDYFGPEDVLVADREDGATTVHRLAPEPLAAWLKDYSLGQLWEKGELEDKTVKG